MNKPKDNDHIKIKPEHRSGKSFIIFDDFLKGNKFVIFDRPAPKSPQDRTKALEEIAEGYGVDQGSDRSAPDIEES